MRQTGLGCLAATTGSQIWTPSKTETVITGLTPIHYLTRLSQFSSCFYVPQIKIKSALFVSQSCVLQVHFYSSSLLPVGADKYLTCLNLYNNDKQPADTESPTATFSRGASTAGGQKVGSNPQTVEPVQCVHQFSLPLWLQQSRWVGRLLPEHKPLQESDPTALR